LVSLSGPNPGQYSYGILTLEPLGAHPICEGSTPTGWCAARKGPHGGVGVKVANQGGGYVVIQFVSEDVMEIMASRGTSVVDIDEAESDRSVVQYIKD